MLTFYILRYLCRLSYISWLTQYIASTLLTYSIQYIIYCTKYHYEIDIIIKYTRYRKVMIITLAMSWFFCVNLHILPYIWWPNDTYTTTHLIWFQIPCVIHVIHRCHISIWLHVFLHTSRNISLVHLYVLMQYYNAVYE